MGYHSTGACLVAFIPELLAHDKILYSKASFDCNSFKEQRHALVRQQLQGRHWYWSETKVGTGTVDDANVGMILSLACALGRIVRVHFAIVVLIRIKHLKTPIL